MGHPLILCPAAFRGNPSSEVGGAPVTPTTSAGPAGPRSIIASAIALQTDGSPPDQGRGFVVGSGRRPPSGRWSGPSPKGNKSPSKLSRLAKRRERNLPLVEGGDQEGSREGAEVCVPHAAVAPQTQVPSTSSGIPKKNKPRPEPRVVLKHLGDSQPIPMW